MHQEIIEIGRNLWESLNAKHQSLHFVIVVIIMETISK